MMYKYFKNWLSSSPAGLYQDSETNIFVDLFNSFRFDDPELRKKSGFKLKSLDLSLIHHLGDWNAKLTVSMIPELERTSVPNYWYFKNEVSFLIMWVPIGEIKAQIDYDGEKLTIK